MGLLLLATSALAGVVSDVPAGETSIDLLVCPTDEPCAQLGYELEQLPGMRDRPILPFDQLLERDGGEWEDGELLSARFDAAMDRARAAWTAGRVEDAGRALEDAHAALERWSGTADAQRLFDLAYLQGAVAVKRGDDPESDFRQAAAVAWNRTVTLAVEDPAAKPYYAVLDRMVSEGTGTVRLAEPPNGGTWFFDGVEVGSSPAELTVFPGVHRITAQAEGMLRTWKKDVQVLAGRRKDVSAAFTPTDDAGWVRAQVREAFETKSLPKEVKELVSTWCARKSVARLRFVRVVEGRMEAMTYEPALRRLGPG